MVGATLAGNTVIVKVWVAAMPFVAVRVAVMGEPTVSGAVPLSTPVVGFNVAQVGKPVALKVAAGELVAAIVKVPATVAWNVVLATLVKTGAVPTVSVAASEVALAPMRLPATA